MSSPTLIRSARIWAATTIVVVAAVLAPVKAFAETLAAPVGGRAIALGTDRVVCRESLVGAAWTAEPDGHAVRPPTRDDAVGSLVTLRVAPNDAACATSAATIGLLAIGAKPTVEPGGVSVEVDAGRIVVRGRHLRGSVLQWSAGGRHGVDACAMPDASTAAGVESCGFAVPRDLPADPTAIDLALVPAGATRIVDARLFDATGHATPSDDYAIRASQIVLARLFPPDASIDVSTGAAHLRLLHADAIASVDCADATCDVEGGELLVRGEHGPDDKLDIHFQLRPRVVLRDGASAESAPVRAVSLQRCPVSLASPPPLVGVAEQRVVIRIGGSCAQSEADLDVATPSGVARVERTLLVGAERYALVHVGKVDTETFTIRVRRRGTVVGVAAVAARRVPALRARFEIPGRGPVDFIPTNRWVKILLPASLGGGSFVPIPVEGAYDIRRDDKGAWIRGADGATGAAFVHFAYVDDSLPAALRDTHLAELTEPVDRMLRVANIPIALGALARDSKAPIVDVLCGDGDGHAQRVASGITASIPYRARDTCQIVLHRERLSDEDGAQAFQVSVQVTSSDGIARSEARVDRRLVLKRSDHPSYVAISGAMRPFDRILVRVALAADETHYAAFSAEQGVPEVQWSIVTGADHFRLYGTAAIPTGLFRVADTGHSGILTLSVGALVRAVMLSRDGTEFPVGLEAGVMWLGVAGDTDPAASSRGAVAIVVGPGISVPIANVSRSTQTSISLHAWFEYEVSRSVLGQNGQAVGFVFGPSISIGDVGTNF